MIVDCMIVGNGAAIIVNGSFFCPQEKKKTSLGFEIVPGGAI